VDAVKIQAPWSDLLAEPLIREHFVQLYEDESTLAEAVALFAGAGFGKSESAVIVATPEHMRGFRDRLGARGFEVDDLERWGQLTMVDAEATLSRFMVDGLPDPDLFKAAVHDLIAGAHAAGRFRKVRVYGEMVNLLWRDNLRAAVELELLWNDVIQAYSITLFCAYGLNGYAPHGFPPVLRALHAHLIPVEALA
jgi:hypothetical protein